LRRIVISACIAGLVSPLLFVTLDGQSEWLRVARNAAHGPIFACIAILIVAMSGPRSMRTSRVSGRWPDWRRYTRSFALALSLGVLVEVLQFLDGRPPSLFDIGSDAAGAAVGLGVWTFFDGSRQAPPRCRPTAGVWLVLALALSGLAYLSWQPLSAVRAYAHRAARFPVIAQFREPVDLFFAVTGDSDSRIVRLPEPWATWPREKTLRVDYGPGRSPTVRIKEPSPDWRGFARLMVDVTNPGPKPLRLVIRILDDRHDWTPEDRFNLSVALAAGQRATVPVVLDAVALAPKGRRMDLARIKDVMLIGRTGSATGFFYVSALWLE